MLVPVLGDMAHVGPPLADGGVGDILAAEGNGSLALLQAGEAVDELRLAVAVDAGDADDLPGAHVKAHIVDRVPLVGPGGHGEVLHLQHRVGGMGRVLHHLQLHRAAHHHVGQGLLVGLTGVHGADALALAQHRHPVGHLHDLVELMGDEEDALSLPGELLHGGHELLDLLGRKDGGGLVENEDLVVPVEHLQYLHPLLHPHGDILHLGVQVHLQTVALGQLLHLLPGLPLLEKAQPGGLRSQDDVVQHREHVDELEVLVDHADAQGSGVIGIIDLHGLTVFSDLSRLRLVQAEEYAHKGGFPRAVLPQESVDLTLAELKGNVVVGDNARKFLRDVKHLDDVFRFHTSRLASFIKYSIII